MALEGQPQLEVFPGGLGQSIQLTLRPTEVTREDSVAELRGPDGAKLQIHGRVQAWTGASDDSAWRAFVAQSPDGAIGWIESTRDARRFVLEGADPDAVGLVEGPWQFVPAGPAAAWPLDDFCTALEIPGGGDGGGGLAGFGPAIRREFTIALDVDNEFRAIFPDAQATLDYLVALYAAIDAIYENDAGFGLRLGLVRIWEEPDPWDASDPLGPFRDWWVANEVNTPRDLAQLVSARRNLPYGGVAWLNAVCNHDYGYSVVGYMNGRIASGTSANPGNWDINVAAHELGHNLGTHHTHAYGLDTCDQGQIRRGTIMSYCHVVSGASSNIDNRFHAMCAQYMRTLVATAGCGLADCNNNGLADAEEIAAGAAQDTNADGVIDSCQDCDADGVIDAEEIANGAADADLNGIPDACQPDCNGNAMPDWAECLADPAIDLDGNGVPDECDPDCDGDGQPDSRQIILNHRHDLDRDARVDVCQDCNSNLVPDGAELVNSLALWTVDGSASVYELDARSGVRHRGIDTGLTSATAVCGLGDGSMLVGGVAPAGGSAGAVVRIARPSGAVSPFLGAAALDGAPVRIRQLPGGTVVVATATRVAGFHPQSGQLLWASQPGFVGGPIRSVLADGIGSFVVLHSTHVSVMNALGALETVFSLDPSALEATDVARLPDSGGSGDFLISSLAADGIFRYSATGAFVGRWESGPNPGSSTAMRDPRALVISPRWDALLSASSDSNTTVAGYRWQNGLMERTHRVYRIDAGAALDMAAAAESALDANRNLMPDECEPSGPAADLDGDGAVGGGDLALLLSQWGPAGGGASADFNGDGAVDGADLAVLVSEWTG